LPLQLVSEFAAGGHWLVHGDDDALLAGRERPGNQRTAKGRMIMGHEHPAIVIGNGVESWAKCPCFLVNEQLIVLPAFSQWAAGTVIGSHPFMSQVAQRAQFRQALAIVGNKLLPVPLA
jgi:metallophosphoesterase superfamily enzyme